LAQALRSLADDRDRLATRLNAFEREMHDMGGGIRQQIEAAKADAIKTATQAPPWPESAPPVPMTLADVAVMVKRISPPPAGMAEQAPAPTSEQAAPEATASVGQTYGADLGTASTIKTLHQRWATLRNAHPQLFEGVQPVVSVKQNPRSGRTELHLIVGPYANAETAAQFCDFVVPFHVNCQPAMFDGSRLALQ
jgi:cell pole-organizing protein PopZ